MKNILSTYFHLLILCLFFSCLPIKSIASFSIIFDNAINLTTHYSDTIPIKKNTRKTKTPESKANHAAFLGSVFAGLSFLGFYFIIPALIFKGIANRRKALLNKTGEQNLKFTKKLLGWVLAYYLLMSVFVVFAILCIRK